MKRFLCTLFLLSLAAVLSGCAGGISQHLLDKSEMQLTSYLASTKETRVQKLSKIKQVNERTVLLGDALAKSINEAGDAQQDAEYKMRQDQIFWGYVGTGIGALATTLGTIITSKDGKVIVGASTATLTAATLIWTKWLENKQGELDKFIKECDKANEQWHSNRQIIESSETDLKKAQDIWKRTNAAYMSLSEMVVSIKRKYTTDLTGSIQDPIPKPTL